MQKNWLWLTTEQAVNLKPATLQLIFKAKKTLLLTK